MIDFECGNFLYLEKGSIIAFYLTYNQTLSVQTLRGAYVCINGVSVLSGLNLLLEKI